MKKKILVCGAGSVGKRHMKNLINRNVEISVWRNRTEKKQELLKAFNNKIKIADDINIAIGSSDAVVVATETSNHRNIIETSIELNKHLYIEKPIDKNPDGLNGLLQQINEKKLIVEIGCQLRKHPCLIKLKEILSDPLNPIYSFRIFAGQRLEDWRPGTDYEKAYSANKDRGGGALLDLIHEIDLTLWLMGDIYEVYGDLSKISDQKIKAEDLVNIIVKLDSGAVGHIQLDLISPVLRRGIEIITKNKIFLWDYNSGILEMITKEKREIIESVPRSFRRNDMFQELMDHFLRRLDGKTSTIASSFEEGMKSLHVVAAVESSFSNKTPVLVEALR